VGSDLILRKIARELGVTEWHGKRLDVDTPARATDGRTMAMDQLVDSSLGSQNEPSIAVDPTDDSRVVVFAQNDDNFNAYDVACSIYLSEDGGVTFRYMWDAPLLNPTDFCSYPVVRYAPDASVVYFSYLSVRDDVSGSDVMVTVGDGEFPTLFVSGPTVVISTGTDFNDKPWLGVHTYDSADGVSDGAGYVYVVTSRMNSTGTCGVYLNHSTDYGASWVGVGGFGALQYSLDCDHNLPHGARVEGAPGPQVLVCYYDSGADGYSSSGSPPTLLNRFDISCRSSSDRGTTFGTIFKAARNVPYEVNYYLGPNALYHRWVGAMFPSMTIDHKGTAHLVFTADPTASRIDAEAGNVQYVRSTAGASVPPYNTWTPRVTIGTGPRAQGYPTIVAQRSLLTTKPFIYIAYYDHYRSPRATPNLFYDVRYRKSINGGMTFAAPITATNGPSLSDASYIGDYFDSAVTMRRYHLVWTDRADKLNVFDPEDAVLADSR
jgi:hypothetical protein